MKVLVAGDFCPRERVAGLFDNGEYEMVLGEVMGITKQVDFSIVNFECPVIYGGEKPISKVGPNLGCSKRGMDVLSKVGFNCVTIANNHIYDYGEEGLRNTISACKDAKIDYVGGGLDNKQASAILYKTIGNQRLAIINCCENEFSIATENTGGANPLDPIKQYHAIKEARLNADHVLVIVHGGHELYPLPSNRMQDTYRFFINAGADAVVNHHQHCYSGYEVYENKPIFYGLGNFCFDHPEYRDSMWNEGYMIVLNFNNSVSFDIIPYKQCNETPTISLLANSSFDAYIKSFNDIIAHKNMLQNKEKEYYESCINNISQYFTPYYGTIVGRILNKLSINTISTKQLLRIRNLVCCESHYDKLKYFLTSKR